LAYPESNPDWIAAALVSRDEGAVENYEEIGTLGTTSAVHYPSVAG
jgi:hypothetical protein